jgi:acyl dehydratase
MPKLRHVKVGTRLPALSKVVTDSNTELIYRRILISAEKLDSGFKKYAYGPNIHTDDATAQAAGFPGRVAPGVQSLSFISEMLGRFFGMGWINGGKIEVKFIRPFLIGEKITCEAEVKKTFSLDKSSGRYAELEVCCKNSTGNMVTVGIAKARIQGQ